MNTNTNPAEGSGHAEYLRKKGKSPTTYGNLPDSMEMVTVQIPKGQFELLTKLAQFDLSELEKVDIAQEVGSNQYCDFRQGLLSNLMANVRKLKSHEQGINLFRLAQIGKDVIIHPGFALMPKGVEHLPIDAKPPQDPAKVIDDIVDEKFYNDLASKGVKVFR